MKRWYNVGERLPQEGELVLLYPIMELARRFGEKWQYYAKVGFIEEQPTWWMYIEYPSRFALEWGKPDLVRRIVTEIISEIANISLTCIKDDDRILEDLGLDNLDMLCLEMKLEKAFNVQSPNLLLKIEKMKVKELIKYIECLTNYEKCIEQPEGHSKE